MTRVPPPKREEIPPELQAAFDAASLQRPRVPRFGNYNVMLYTPEACLRVHHWADYLLKESTLSDPIRQLAFLVVAREHDCQFVWNAHAALGRKAGLSPGLVDALRDKQPLPPLKPDEQVAIKFGQEYYRTGRVSKGTFQEGTEQFGVRGLAELTMLMGFTAALVFNLHAFDIDLPDERTEPILPIF